MIKNVNEMIKELNKQIENCQKKVDYYMAKAEKATHEFYFERKITPSKYEEILDYCDLNASTCRAQIEKMQKKINKLKAKERKRTLKFKKFNAEKESSEETKQPGQE